VKNNLENIHRVLTFSFFFIFFSLTSDLIFMTTLIVFQSSNLYSGETIFPCFCRSSFIKRCDPALWRKIDSYASCFCCCGTFFKSLRFELSKSCGHLLCLTCNLLATDDSSWWLLVGCDLYSYNFGLDGASRLADVFVSTVLCSSHKFQIFLLFIFYLLWTSVCILRLWLPFLNYYEWTPSLAC
jgi:hypothetical protein